MGENALTLRMGNTRRLRVTVQDLTDPLNPVNIPVTPADRVRCTITPNTDPTATPIIEKDSNNVGEVIYTIGGQTHVFDVVLLAADSASEEEGEYVYDAKVDFASSEAQTVVMDTITFIQPPTGL